MPSREEMIAFLQKGQEQKPSREEMISYLKGQTAEAPREETSFLASAVDTAGKILDIPVAPIRGAVGAMVGTEHQGFSPWSAPSSQEIIEKVAPSTAKPISLRDFSRIPAELRPDEKMLQMNGIAPEVRASELIAPYADIAAGFGSTKAIQAGAKKMAPAIANLSKTLGGFAEQKAVNATGATAAQSEKFAENAGRELLDRKVVRFGDSQKNIADRASRAMDLAHEQIDTALKALDAKGITISAEELKSRIGDRISKMKTDPSKADVTRMLNAELKNLDSAVASKGTPQFGMQETENIKRGYNRKAGNWADPEKSMAGKEMYQTLRGAVEDAAQAADPSLATVFDEGKKSHGLLKPIKEAAERRAAVNSQSPLGGFGDVMTAGAGGAAAGPLGIIPAVVAKRIIQPRLASSVAVSADKIANGLRSISGLAQIESENPAAFQAMVQAVEGQFRQAPSMSLPRAAETQDAEVKPKKGPEKWASDGFAKLEEHTGESLGSIEDLKSNPKTRELLIEASDLKPGSKAMARIASQIRSKGKD